MNYLLDTNHWSYLQRREAMVVSHIQSLPDDATLSMPVVAQAELLAGVELAVSEPRQQELRTLYAPVIAMAADILPITSEVAEQFAHIFAHLRRKGRSIDTNDIWIAAIARVHNLVVVTNDDHFQYVEGLQVETGQKPPHRARASKRAYPCRPWLDRAGPAIRPDRPS